MLRKLLFVVLPLALPFIIYGSYLLLARRKARRMAEGRPADWQDAPWGWILGASILLTVAALGYYRETSGVDREAPFLPPLSGPATVEPGAATD
jgi:hypothetical protein